MWIHYFTVITAFASTIVAYHSAKLEDKVRVSVQCLIGIGVAAARIMIAWLTQKGVWTSVGILLVFTAAPKWFGMHVNKSLK